jgi:hypothetical protein
MNTTVIPFSKRLTASNALTRCMFACREAQRLSSNIVVTNDLQYLHAEMFSVLRRLRHQDVPDQSARLDAAITSAVALVSTLNGIVQAMPQLTPAPENMNSLSNVQTVVSGTLAALVNCAAVE